MNGFALVIPGVMSAEMYINTVYITLGMPFGQAHVAVL